MKRIDFLGASGAGKSAVFDAIARSASREKQWFTPKEAKTAAARQYIKQNKRMVKDFKPTLLLNLPLFRPFHPQVSNYVLRTHGTKLLWENAQRDKPFLNTVLKGAGFENREPLHRLLGINWFVPVYRDVLIMENSPLESLVIFDESLSQKVYGITHWKQGAFEEITAAYFNSIPLPAGLIHFKIASQTAMERLNERPKVTTGQRNSTGEELFNVISAQVDIARTGADIIKYRGVKVLEIESELPIERKVVYINKFIADSNV